jgi:hypothetical protein
MNIKHYGEWKTNLVDGLSIEGAADEAGEESGASDTGKRS